jgi:LPXTG-motif cell wall-anchored protein
MTTKKFLLFFALLLAFVPLASATVQDDFCTYLNENISVSDCNLIWGAITNETTTIIYQTNETIINNTIKNTSYFLNDSYVTFDSLDIRILDTVNSLNKSLRVDMDSMYSILSTSIKSLNNSFVSQEEQDSTLTILDILEAEQEREREQRLICSRFPDSVYCDSSFSSSDSFNDSELSELVDLVNQLSRDINEIESSTQPETEEETNISLYLLGVGLLVVGGLYYFDKKNKVNQKTIFENTSASKPPSSNYDSIEQEQWIKAHAQKQEPPTPESESPSQDSVWNK